MLHSYDNQKSMILAEKNRHTDQWNRTDSTEGKPHIYGQIIFNKGAKNTQWTKESLFKMVLGKLESHMEKNKTRLQFVPM